MDIKDQPDVAPAAWRFGPFVAAFLFASILGLVMSPNLKSCYSDLFETMSYLFIVLLWSVFLLARRWRVKNKVMYWVWISVTLCSPYWVRDLAYTIATQVFQYGKY